MMISIVIATRDRAALLASTLHALTAQDCPGDAYEIVVVDNGSVDDTAAVVDMAARRGAPIHYIYESRPGKSHALNTGIATARGDVLVLTDDDVLPSRTWLQAYVRAFSDTGADYAVGRIVPLWEVAPPRWLSPALYGVLAVPDGGDVRVMISKGVNEDIMPLGANMAVRRHVLDRVGGWNPHLGKLQGTLRTGEDHEFSLKMIDAGFVGVYEPGACVQHRVPADRLRFGYFQRWYYDNGAIEAGLEQDYPSTSRYLFDVPRYLWRQLILDVATALAGILTFDLRRAAAGELRVAWFAGYVRARWKSRSSRSRVRAHAAPVARS